MRTPSVYLLMLIVEVLDFQYSLGVAATLLAYVFSAVASNTLLAHLSADAIVF
ncbi:MAG: hypothetical protein QW067_12030 [Thermofilaceae archaeon]